MLRSRLSGIHTDTCSPYPIPDSRRARTQCVRVYLHLRYALQPRLVTDLASLIRVYTVWSDVVTLQHEYVCMRPHKYRAASGVWCLAVGIFDSCPPVLIQQVEARRGDCTLCAVQGLRYLQVARTRCPECHRGTMYLCLSQLRNPVIS